jgi:hypothetical protein
MTEEQAPYHVGQEPAIDHVPERLFRVAFGNKNIVRFKERSKRELEPSQQRIGVGGVHKFGACEQKPCQKAGLDKSASTHTPRISPQATASVIIKNNLQPEPESISTGHLTLKQPQLRPAFWTARKHGGPGLGAVVLIPRSV